jgi:hypothetical protein
MKENPRFTRDTCISNQTEEGEGSKRQEGRGGGERGRRKRPAAQPPRLGFSNCFSYLTLFAFFFSRE